MYNFFKAICTTSLKLTVGNLFPYSKYLVNLMSNFFNHLVIPVPFSLVQASKTTIQWNKPELFIAAGLDKRRGASTKLHEVLERRQEQ